MLLVNKSKTLSFFVPGSCSNSQVTCTGGVCTGWTQSFSDFPTANVGVPLYKVFCDGICSQFEISIESKQGDVDLDARIDPNDSTTTVCNSELSAPIETCGSTADSFGTDFFFIMPND